MLDRGLTFGYLRGRTQVYIMVDPVVLSVLHDVAGRSRECQDGE